VAGLGIEPARIAFSPPLPLAEYYRQYHQIDIALDTFPYAGGTTTCDTVWMGVPVVTRFGDTAVSRGGASILSQLGLTDLIATTPEQYVRIAVDLAADPARLSQLRCRLRQHMRNSPLMDAAQFARKVEAAFRSMWNTWCNSAR
jgi:protein O-GlcNAc transferase